MRTGKYAEVDGDRTDLGEGTAVDADVLVEHEIAEDLDLHLADGGGDGGQLLAVFRRNDGQDLGACRFHGGAARVLALGEHGSLEGRTVLGHELVHQILGELRHEDDFELRLPGLGAQFELEGAEAFDLSVSGVKGVEDDRLVDLAGSGFDHHDRVGRAGDDQIEVGKVALGVRGVDDDLTINRADAHGADRVWEGDFGDDQSGRGGVDGEDVRVVLTVCRENKSNDLRLLAVPRLE